VRRCGKRINIEGCRFGYRADRLARLPNSRLVAPVADLPRRNVLLMVRPMQKRVAPSLLVRTVRKLWAVGRYMIVQVDCNGFDPRAKYELYTSTREHAKETPIKK
jgi:hypothetical protein